MKKEKVMDPEDFKRHISIKLKKVEGCGFEEFKFQTQYLIENICHAFVDLTKTTVEQNNALFQTVERIDQIENLLAVLVTGIAKEKQIQSMEL